MKKRWGVGKRGEEGRKGGGKDWKRRGRREKRGREAKSPPLLSVQRQTVRECLASSPTQRSSFPLWLKSTLHTPTE